MRSIAWLSEKGGSGKTTSAINTAVCFAKKGKKTLLVDADPQGNASLVLLEGKEPTGPTLFHVLTGSADAADTIQKTATPRLHLMPADTLLAQANVSLASEVGRERRLLLAMRGLEDRYDFIVVDTSPQRTVVNINVLNYVEDVICPIDPGIFALQGLAKLQSAIAEVVQFLDNDRLKLAGLVITQATNDNLSRDIETQLRATFGSLVYETKIPGSIKIGEAHSRYRSILDYAPRSPGAIAYDALAREIIANGATHGIVTASNGPVAIDRAEGSGLRRKRRAG